MYGLAEYEVLGQRNDEVRAEVALGRPTTIAPEDRETGPYVVRDLSWELARYLDTETVPASASAASNSASGHHGRIREEARVSA